jgi:hypothetical protein
MRHSKKRTIGARWKASSLAIFVAQIVSIAEPLKPAISGST